MVLIGMTEISSCVNLPEIQEGAHVEKGQQLGHFQFGGSSAIVIIPKQYSTPNMWDGIDENEAFKVKTTLIYLNI